ncbi:MAG: hypothetical protein IPQ07_19090 [Myxococcales bacterium]|nr:hypothetical protein [Myxococcales bacterium]
MPRARRVLVAVLIVLTQGCGSPAGTGVRSKPTAAQGASLPAMLGFVPADAPYVIASLDPLERSEVAKVVEVLGGAFVGALESSAQSDTTTASFLAAIRAELGGPWTPERHEALGFSATPRFVLYGLGLMPVLRIELANATAALATIERVAVRMKVTLPPMETRGAARFWRTGKKGDLVVAIAGGELVIAAGPRKSLDGVLDLALGLRKPTDSMADGARLVTAMKRHGLGSHLIGSVDLRRVIDELVASSAPMSPACRGKVEALATQLPRVTLGHRRGTENAITAGLFLELGGDLLSNARELPVQATGVASLLRGPSILTMAGGLDLAALGRLGHDLAERMRQLGEVCGKEELRDVADKVDAKLAVLTTGIVPALTSFAIALYAFEPGADAKDIPKRLDGVVLVSATDATGVFAQLVAVAPKLGALGLAPDGELHEILAGKLPLPFPLYAGVGGSSMIVAAGAEARGRAETALADTVMQPVPFLTMDYDYAKFDELQRALGVSTTQADPGTYQRLVRSFGRGRMTVALEDDSLAVWTMIELK